MTVCKFWLQGTCKFGDKCRFEHPPNVGAPKSAAGHTTGQGPGLFGRVEHNQSYSQNQGVFGRQPDNHQANGASRQAQQTQGVFGRQPAHQNQNNFARNQDRQQDRSRGGYNQRPNHGRNHPADRAYGVTQETIETDLRLERPQWLMSCYGPGKDPAVQLLGGYPLEQSFEEVRAEHYLAITAGDSQAGVENEAKLAQQSNGQVTSVLQNTKGALTFLENGAKTHPNRLEIIAAGSDFVRLVDAAYLSHQWATRPTSFGANFKFDAPLAPAMPQPTVPTPATTTFAPLLKDPGSTISDPSIPASKVGSQAPNQTPAFPSPANTLLSATSLPNTSSNVPEGFNQQPQGAQPFQQGSLTQQPNGGPSLQQANGMPYIPTGPISTPDLSTYAQFSNGRLMSWKGKQVTEIDGQMCYRREDGQWERIWFPNGAPELPTASDIPEDIYMEDVKDDFGYLGANGAFKNGAMPELPPKAGWARFDI